MRIKRYIPFLTCVLLLAAVITATAFAPKDEKSALTPLQSASGDETANYSGNEQTANQDNKNKSEEGTELRGVWVTYMDLTMPKGQNLEDDFRKKFTEIAENCKNKGFNTLIVQVRPFSDSLYYSEIFPFSHVISGTQGERCDYDPLKIMCEITDSLDIKIHAWVNPYRVKLNETPYSLSSDNPYVKNKNLGVELESGIYYNPALSEVRNLITDGVCEIVRNYNIDGIQFDDYFYPTEDESFDKAQYDEYLNSSDKQMSLADWRKANVNLLIAQCWNEIHSIKNDVKFGISPQGNIDNNAALGADIESWCRCRGYIDYICPQLYYSTENPSLKFSDALDRWCGLEYHSGCKLYIGLAGYKAGSDESDGGTWEGRDDILSDEIKQLREKNINGFMLYSYQSLVSEKSANEIENVVKLLN